MHPADIHQGHVIFLLAGPKQQNFPHASPSSSAIHRDERVVYVCELVLGFPVTLGRKTTNVSAVTC